MSVHVIKYHNTIYDNSWNKVATQIFKIFLWLELIENGTSNRKRRALWTPCSRTPLEILCSEAEGRRLLGRPFTHWHEATTGHWAVEVEGWGCGCFVLYPNHVNFIAVEVYTELRICMVNEFPLSLRRWTDSKWSLSFVPSEVKWSEPTSRRAFRDLWEQNQCCLSALAGAGWCSSRDYHRELRTLTHWPADCGHCSDH